MHFNHCVPGNVLCASKMIVLLILTLSLRGLLYPFCRWGKAVLPRSLRQQVTETGVTSHALLSCLKSCPWIHFLIATESAFCFLESGTLTNMSSFPWSFKPVGKASLKSCPSIPGIFLACFHLETQNLIFLRVGTFGQMTCPGSRLTPFWSWWPCYTMVVRKSMWGHTWFCHMLSKRPWENSFFSLAKWVQ